MDQTFLLYNGFDVEATQQVHDAIWPELKNSKNADIYEWTVRLFNPLMFMMSRGMRVDRDRLQKVSKRTEEKMDELLEKIEEACGRPLNPNSVNDCKKYFYVERNIPPYYKTNSKGRQSITVDDKALTRLARGTSSRRGLPEAKLIQNYRRLRKLKSTYLDIEFDRDSRLRCFYNPRGSRFSRLSSSKTVFETGMNMQNLPEEFRDFLVPDPGYLMIELDKRQAEWVVVAYDCGDASMLKIIEEGGDPHTYTASMMFKLPQSLIDFENKLVGHLTDPAEIKEIRKKIQNLRDYKGWLISNMSLRQAGKKSNHGLNYDEGPVTFGLVNGIPQSDAKRLIELYHSTYPGVRQWHKRIQRQLSEDKTLVNCFGRYYTFREKWGDKLFKAAYSYNPQSTVGDLTNRTLVKVYEDNSSGLEHLELLAQVHDSILFQIPFKLGVEQIWQTIQKCRNHFDPQLEINGREFKIQTDIKIGSRSWKRLTDSSLESFATFQRDFEKELANAPSAARSSAQ